MCVCHSFLRFCFLVFVHFAPCCMGSISSASSTIAICSFSFMRLKVFSVVLFNSYTLNRVGKCSFTSLARSAAAVLETYFSHKVSRERNHSMYMCWIVCAQHTNKSHSTSPTLSYSHCLLREQHSLAHKLFWAPLKKFTFFFFFFFSCKNQIAFLFSLIFFSRNFRHLKLFSFHRRTKIFPIHSTTRCIRNLMRYTHTLCSMYKYVRVALASVWIWFQ